MYACPVQVTPQPREQTQAVPRCHLTAKELMFRGCEFPIQANTLRMEAEQGCPCTVSLGDRN